MITIVLYGPPLAGKLTLLQAFARSRGTVVTGRRRNAEPTAAYEYFVKVNVEGFDIEVTTITGAVWDREEWWTLIERCSAIVATFDLQRGCEQLNREARSEVAPYLATRVHVAILTKADVCAGRRGHKVCFNATEATRLYDLDGWEIFVSSRSAPAVNAIEATIAAIQRGRQTNR